MLEALGRSCKLIEALLKIVLLSRPVHSGLGYGLLSEDLGLIYLCVKREYFEVIVTLEGFGVGLMHYDGIFFSSKYLYFI